MKQQGPLQGGTRTSSSRQNSPRLPNLPKNPVRATGGNSAYNTVNRLSAQAAKAAPAVAKSAAKAVGRGVMKAVGTRAAIGAAALQGGKLNPGTLAYNQKLAASMMKKKKSGK
jgi:hypothetical protein